MPLQTEGRPVLADSATAAMLLGLPPEAVADAADRGVLVWVFDVGSGSHRLLRFWLGELLNPGQRTRALAPEYVFACIVGEAPFLPRRTVEQLLGIARPSLYDLVEANILHMVNSDGCRRQDLIAFLQRRWLSRVHSALLPPPALRPGTRQRSVPLALCS